MAPEPEKAQLLHQLRIDRSDREEVAGSQRKWWRWGVLAVAVVGAAAPLVLMRSSAIEVSEATAVSASASAAPTAILQATGYVTAEREATVSSQIAGQVSHVYFDEGGHARRGQVLARLDDSVQHAALAQAKAQWAATRGDLRAVQGIASGAAVVQSPPARLEDGARIAVESEQG